MGTRTESGVFASARLISLCTLGSRVLGLARDCLSAAVFGAGPVWDAFAFAFRIPNLLRRLFGEGALSAAFIPIFAEYLQRGDEAETGRVAGAVGGAVLAVLSVVLALCEMICGGLLLSGVLPEKWHLAVTLTAVLLPYSLLICMTAYVAGVLQSLRHFAAPALAPVVLNLVWLAALWLSGPLFGGGPERRVYVLAGGILTAGLLQLGLQLRALRGRLRLRLRWEPGHEALRRGLRRMGPIVLGLAVFQLNCLMDGVIAIGLSRPEGATGGLRLFGLSLAYPMEAGANSVLYYGDRLMQFPLGVFGIALATALFPTLSEHAARRDWPGFSVSLREALGAVGFIGLPAGVGLMVLSRPTVALLFERGAWTAVTTDRTAAVVVAYGLGVWAYCALQVLVRAFYAVGDTVTPVRVSAAMVALNLTLNLCLVWPFGAAGMAGATAFCAALQVVWLTTILVRRGRLRLDGPLLGSLLRTAGGVLLMVPVCLVVARLLPAEGPGLGGRLLGVGGAIAAGAGAFLAVGLLTRNRALRVLLSEGLADRLGL
jgi:putative peptidoglycan lipid II flippase